MIQEVKWIGLPEEAANEAFIESYLRQHLNLKKDVNIDFRWHKQSIDARKNPVKIQGVLHVSVGKKLPSRFPFFQFKDVRKAPEIHIIGTGPAGLFAALRAIELGLKPILFERGKDVRERRRDLAKLNKEGLVNPESNYCFGEGGAGTYSDGKLYTRSKKRGDVEKVLQLLVQFGADDNILVNAHPHVGTNKLPQLITAIREQIIACGGEVHFNCKLTDFQVDNGKVKSLTINGTTEVPVRQVILATGHSARDIFHLFNDKQLTIKAKPFALGVRVEHTQELIDKIQYHGRLNDDYLPPASYSLVTQVEDRGVYSFCMCPGGIIAPCATADGEVVTNGWSPSKRNNPYSNSGIVVSIDPSDFENPTDPLVCLKFQQEIEQKCWELAGKNQQVPAQRLLDFVQRKKSPEFPRSSYQPGIVSIEMDEIFPPFVVNRLRQAFKDFGQKMKGFLTNDAVIHAPESRTSSPVLIPRNPETLTHLDLENLYPCAEGAGYAGGIVSAAIDGMKCVEKIHENSNLIKG